MCGRFTLRTPLSQLVKQFGVTAIPELAPRYNIAPTQEVVAVRAAGSGQSSSHAPSAVAADGTRSLPATQSDRELVLLHWGLIPPWADDPRVGNRAINARSETADSKPAFREPFRQRRCLVVADGFYEWKTVGRVKQPYYIHAADDRPFAFAGLWERWRRGDQRIESCTILTTDANQRLADLHDRMPVILQPRDYDLWLDTAVQEVSRLKRLLIPCPVETLTLHPVGNNVNRPSTDGPECIAPTDAQAMLPGFR